MTVTVVNSDRLQRRLAALPEKVGNKIQQKASREVAKRIQVTAKADAPVGETGALQRSIKVRSMRKKRNQAFGGAMVMIDLRVLSAAGARNDYASFQEYGTRYIEADRYLSIATARNKRTAEVVFRSEVQKSITEATRVG